MASNPSLLLLPDPNPFGTSREQWTQKWWAWLNAIPRQSNPAFDQTGNYGSLNQTEPLWFLAGTMGQPAKRKCTIPQKPVLFPIINSIHFTSESSFESESEMVSKVKIEAENVEEMAVTFDGIDIPDLKQYRIHARPFDVMLPVDNIWKLRAGQTRAAADGYWIFLKSPLIGKHALAFFGRDADGFESKVTYDLTVK